MLYGNPGGINPEFDEMDAEFYEQLQEQFPEMLDEHNLEEFAEAPIENHEILVENLEPMEMQPEAVPEAMQEAVPEPVEIPIEVEESYDDEPIHHEQLPDSYAVRPISKKEELYREIEIDITDPEMGPEMLDAYWDYVLSEGVNKDHRVLSEIPVKEGVDRYPQPELDDAISHPFASRDYLDKHKNPFDGQHHLFKQTLERVKDLGISFSSISHEEGRENMQKKYNEILEPLVEKKKAMLEGYSKSPQYFNKSRMFNEVLPDLNNKIKKIKGVWDQYSNWK